LSRSALALWFDVCQSAFDAAVTIERRLTLIGESYARGSFTVEPEMLRMGPEKALAFAEGMTAASLAAAAEWPRLALDPTRMAAASLAVMRAAARPAHKAVGANARRLGRARRKAR
jgi:hypothetical protein